MIFLNSEIYFINDNFIRRPIIDDAMVVPLSYSQLIAASVRRFGTGSGYRRVYSWRPLVTIFQTAVLLVVITDKLKGTLLILLTHIFVSLTQRLYCRIVSCSYLRWLAAATSIIRQYNTISIRVLSSLQSSNSRCVNCKSRFDGRLQFGIFLLLCACLYAWTWSVVGRPENYLKLA